MRLSNESSESEWNSLGPSPPRPPRRLPSPTSNSVPSAPSPLVRISPLDVDRSTSRAAPLAHRGDVPAELRFNFGNNMLTGIGSASAGGECREERGRSVAGAGVCAMLDRLLMNDVGVLGCQSGFENGPSCSSPVEALDMASDTSETGFEERAEPMAEVYGQRKTCILCAISCSLRMSSAHTGHESGLRRQLCVRCVSSDSHCTDLESARSSVETA